MRAYFYATAAIFALCAVAFAVWTFVRADAALYAGAPFTAAPRPREARVLFGGDMMFDRTVRAAAQESGYDFIFSCIREELARADLMVANLEGPITERLSVSLGSRVGEPGNTRFTFAPATATALRSAGVGVVSLANNHSLDFGPEGARSTKQHLDAANVGYFGLDGLVYEKHVNEVPLVFIGYNEFAPEGAEDSASSTLRAVAGARGEGKLPIVFAHWGAEYAEALPRVQALAHRFVDAGAELVIGAHPHVVQESELYAGKYIYYSLGNFIFDQYFSPQVRSGLLVEATFTKEGLSSVSEIPVELGEDRRTCAATAGR